MTEDKKKISSFHSDKRGESPFADIEYLKKLVKERLYAMPPDVSFSIGSFGDFTRDELIREVEDESEVGKETIDMQINFIRKMSTILDESIDF
ncbi:MAG: hypothetical protein U9Q22_04660 [Candidatus Altiarchaeota archaeon]|nr:hypothetical protein [Candidatus Altiarchaeota archaeon]